ncbi:hypothetical protein Tco_1216650 [Tanacetum coccineum]
MKLMEKRRKHFAALRAQEKRNRPPTKAQKRTQMSTYLKHMGGYTYKQLKGKSFDEIQKLFDKEMKRVNTFIAMGSEVQESKEKKEEGREETAKVEEEQESKEVDEVELKKLLVIKKDEDIAIDAIPLATKLPVIIDYKLHKEGMLVHYQLIKADGSSKRYSSMIRMLQGIDREDLEALWRIVKEKYGDTRPENEFERVLYGDLKVMFEPDIKSDIWRMLQGYIVTIWKLIDSSRVYFVRRNLKIQKMNIKFGGGLLGLKRLHGFLEVTAAQVLNGNYAKWKQFPLLVKYFIFDPPTKNVDNGEPKTVDDAQKQVEDGLNNENDEQERFADDSSSKDVNAVGQQVNTVSPDVNIGNLKLNVVGPSVSTASPNEEDSTEEEPEVDLGNITNSYIVPTTPNTRIHKDHPIDNVIGEVQSTVQTRRMSKPTSEQGFLKAMKEELLQFKLQQVWILVDLPNRKKGMMGDADDVDVLSKIYDGVFDVSPLSLHLDLISCFAEVLQWSLSDFGEQVDILARVRKQTVVATSTTEAEYVAAASCCSMLKVAKSTAWNEFSSSMASLIICLATNQKFNLSKYIFDAMVKHLDRGFKFLLYLRFLHVFINQQLGNMSTHKKIIVYPFHTKKVFANMKRARKDFYGRIIPLFDTMMEQTVKKWVEIRSSNYSTAIHIIEHNLPLPNPRRKNHLKVVRERGGRDSQAKEIVALKNRIQRPGSLGAPGRCIQNRGGLIDDIEADVDVFFGIMIEPEVPLKRKDQIALDEQIARDIQAKLDAELLEEQKLARKQEEEANIALIDVFLKGNKKTIFFVAMGSEVQESKEKKEEGREEKAKGSRKKMLGRKRAGKEQQKESSKKQKVEEEKESDEVELKKLLVIKKDEDIAIDDIPLATKLPMIIDYKLHKRGV